jgi:Mlc titration factor MtfA (ptsG expression regulator)
MNTFSDNNFILIILISFVLYSISKYFKYNLPGSSYIKDAFSKYILHSKLNPIYQPYLQKYFPVYNKLNEEERDLFERRVQKFINMKTFVSRGEIKEITPEMKAIIAGTAIQITIGYPDVYFSHFRTIIIYPDKYYSRITKQYHNGEVNKLGVIVLSWKNFMEGFRDPRDGVNLGYHEMAHALKLEEIVDNEDYSFTDSFTLREFETEAMKEMKKVKESPANESFLREYAATNLSEFFAVAIENYFERPKELKEYNIKLYKLLSEILNFDIMAVQNF